MQRNHIQLHEKLGQAFTLLGVFRGEMAIFLPGILCKLVVWGSDRVMVLGGITGEFWVRTLPKDTIQMI